jgi:acetyl esterase/lipase
LFISVHDIYGLLGLLFARLQCRKQAREFLFPQSEAGLTPGSRKQFASEPFHDWQYGLIPHILESSAMGHKWSSDFLIALLCIANSYAAESDLGTRLIDIEFAHAGNRVLNLDLHLPAKKPRTPLIVWVHGGAWRSGSKKNMPLGKLVAEGYAVASVDYRLSTEAKFPAQVHDLKASIRFLRGRASKWNLPTKILIAGDSAGGHLAALVGVSNGNAELEGDLGDDRAQSSEVQGIISFYGAANLTTILNQSTPHGLKVRVPALELLLGDLPTNAPAIAQLASPVFHVDKNDPPLLLLHGDQDAQMPVNQALELASAYQKAGAPVQLEIVNGAAHGGSIFYDDERMMIVRKFLNRNF